VLPPPPLLPPHETRKPARIATATTAAIRNCVFIFFSKGPKDLARRDGERRIAGSQQAYNPRRAKMLSQKYPQANKIVYFVSGIALGGSPTAGLGVEFHMGTQISSISGFWSGLLPNLWSSFSAK
jgi:hypothetical protein